MITKQETLEFIEYLRNKEDVILESNKIPRNSFFNHWVEDTLPQAEAMLDVIKKASDAKKVYYSVAREKTRQNSAWKKMPEFGAIFIEDLAEYLEGLGIENAELTARQITCSTNIVTGADLFKQYPDKFTPEFVSWSKSAAPLDSRHVFMNLFPTEYLNFRLKKNFDTEDRYQLEAIELQGRNNYYFPLSHRLELQDERITVGYDPEKNHVTEEQMLSLARFICENFGQSEVNLVDYTKKEAVVVRKKLKGDEGIRCETSAVVNFNCGNAGLSV